MPPVLKSFALAAVASATLAASAGAADLPRRAPPPVFTPVPVFTWTGFYLGANAGYAFSERDNVRTAGIGALQLNVDRGLRRSSVPLPQDGFTGGGQIGYNYQFTPGSGVVVGIEADAQYADFGRQRNRFSAIGANGSAIIPGTLVFNPNGLSGLDYFGTVRGRLGYAFDRTLVYATGGFAYGSGGGRQFGTGVNSDDFQTGYAVGGGVEYALPTDSFLNFFRSSAVTLKVEGLYVNLEQNRRTAGSFAQNIGGALVSTTTPGVTLVSGPANTRRDTEFAVVRAGVNYKFGSY